MAVCEKENVSHTEDGLEAILFTAQGDMRQVTNVDLSKLFNCLNAASYNNNLCISIICFCRESTICSLVTKVSVMSIVKMCSRYGLNTIHSLVFNV